MKKKSAKSIAARKALIVASIAAKEAIKVLAAMTGEELTVNQMLMQGHREATGESEFLTFNGWKAKGFCVCKGETCFRIWGSPRKCKSTNESTGEDSSYSMFPVCALFHAGQVEEVAA